MTSLLITGYSGYIGRRLMLRINELAFRDIVCVGRHIRDTSAFSSKHLRVIQADISEPDSYQSLLSRDTTILHLAAATGKMASRAYDRVNYHGTVELLHACRKADIRHFIHVSTVAVNFPDIRGYHYAQSKRMAETAVKSSGLPHTIVRPAMVIGHSSPNWLALRDLSRLPVVPLFGRGTNLIQPIFVDDLIQLLLDVLTDPDGVGGLIEIGGPHKLTLHEFLATIRQRLHEPSWRFVPLPIAPVKAALQVLDPFCSPILPLTAAQLCALVSDSTTRSHPLTERRSDAMATPSEMIHHAMREEPSTSVDDTTLRHECSALTKYIIGDAPSSYIISKYCHAHRDSPPLANRRTTLSDAFFTFLAVRHPFLARLVDAYTRILAPRSLIRTKLVLLLSILEASPHTYQAFDRTSSTTFLRFAGHGAFIGARSFVYLMLSCCLCLPVHVSLLLISATLPDT